MEFGVYIGIYLNSYENWMKNTERSPEKSTKWSRLFYYAKRLLSECFPIKFPKY